MSADPKPLRYGLQFFQTGVRGRASAMSSVRLSSPKSAERRPAHDNRSHGICMATPSSDHGTRNARSADRRQYAVQRAGGLACLGGFGAAGYACVRAVGEEGEEVGYLF
jgi:hypothetical protein